MTMNKVIITALLLILVYDQLSAQNPNWPQPDKAEFEYSANVVATIQLDGVISNNVADTIAFFDGSDIRGLSTPISLGNGQYRHFVTIYAHHAIDTLIIKVYHQGTDHIYEVQQAFIFEVQRITGSVDNPYIINIYPDNDAPISLLPVPDQNTLEGEAFTVIDMATYLVQPDPFDVDWSYTANPNLIVEFQGSELIVSPMSGFTGQTQLVVRATEQSMAMMMSGGNNASRATSSQQYAEVTITYQVTPLYLPPLWNPAIPSQGILLGETFDNIALHDFENQFEGPLIKYDYLPLIVEKVPPSPIPDWQVITHSETTMNLVAKVNYTPKYQFHHPDDKLAAFVGDEIVGVAQRNSINGLYYLSIRGDNINDSIVTLKFYSGEMKDVLIAESTFLYQQFTILGHDVYPYVVDFTPLLPVVPDLPVSNGTYVMPINIVDPDWIGSLTFMFFALDPEYPQFLFDTTNATFCVTTDLNQLTTYYQDADGDGLGNPLISTNSCGLPIGYVTNNYDCDDADPLNITSNIVATETSGSANNDGYICSGALVVLNHLSGQSYLWSNGATTASITVNPTVTSNYAVTTTYSSGCQTYQTTTIHVEGTVVMISDNDGFGSLRQVLHCINEGGTITYNQPTIDSSYLTSSLGIDKNVTINGLNTTSRPVLFIDLTLAPFGLTIDENKTLNLSNIDLSIGNNAANKAAVTGLGNVHIQNLTVIKDE